MKKFLKIIAVGFISLGWILSAIMLASPGATCSLDTAKVIEDFACPAPLFVIWCMICIDMFFSIFLAWLDGSHAGILTRNHGLISAVLMILYVGVLAALRIFNEGVFQQVTPELITLGAIALLIYPRSASYYSRVKRTIHPKLIKRFPI